MLKNERKYLLALAVLTAKESVKIVMKKGSNVRKLHQDFRRDIKIKADKMLEQSILKKLRQRSPYPLLSEECGAIKGLKDDYGYRWIVDPLDGTMNFSRGIPISCVSISLWKENKPFLGVVYDFNNNECFTGIVGDGAWLNGKRIYVGKVDEISRAVLCTGFPSASDFTKKAIGKFIGSVRKFKKVRLLGSAALSLAYVACGRTDFYYENNIKIWDVAAGLCLVKAAGGLVRYKQTGRENTLIVKAGNRHLFGF